MKEPAGRRQDAQHELGLGVTLPDLPQLVGVIEGQLGHAALAGEGEVGAHLDGVGEDDSLRGHAQPQHLLYLGPAGAVEARPQQVELRSSTICT